MSRLDEVKAIARGDYIYDQPFTRDTCRWAVMEIVKVRKERDMALAMNNDLAKMNAQFVKELDKCAAWHEGDCSPHA